MKRIIVTLTAAALLSLGACGGGGPSNEEIVGVLTSDGEITQKQAECMAELLKDSDLSDESLQFLVDNPEEDLPNGEMEVVEDLNFVECR